MDNHRVSPAISYDDTHGLIFLSKNRATGATRGKRSVLPSLD